MWPRTFGRALRHRNYRLFFSGQSVSLIGTWLTRVAMSWLVYRLTHSAWILGLVGFASQLPTFLLSPLAGVWVDRLDRRRVLLITQTAAMLQSALLALLTLTGHAQVTALLVLGAAQGCINAFDMPARQAFVVEMVEDRADLPNAIALNSSMVNGARLLGPALAGALIAVVGEGWCFALDATSYLAVIASLQAMRVPAVARSRSQSNVLGDLRDGWRYVTGFPPVRAVLLLLALSSIMGMPYVVLMPLFAARVLGGSSHTLGWLMAASGLGALAGTLYLASRPSVLGLGRVIPTAAALFGLSLVVFAQSRLIWVSLAILTVSGASMMIQMAASNTVVQTVAEDQKRGRVMSFYAMAFAGTAPFGSLLAGAMAARIGAPMTLVAGGASCIVGALLFRHVLPSLRAHARPVYERLGILPPLSAGLDSATHLLLPPR